MNREKIKNKWMARLNEEKPFSQMEADKLVDEVKCSFSFVDKEQLTERSLHDYFDKAARLLEERCTPAEYCEKYDLSKSSYHAYRAAFIQVCLALIKSEDDEKDLQFWCEKFIQTINEKYWINYTYKPNKARIAQLTSQHYAERSGQAPLTKEQAVEKDMEIQEKEAQRKSKQGRNSKRSSLKGLPQNWRLLVERVVSEQYVMHTLILHLVGCRGQELENGISISLEGNILTVNIKSAKYDGKNKGVPEREIEFDIEQNLRARKVAELMKLEEGKENLCLPGSIDALRKAYKRAAIKALGKSKGKNVSPYSARHQFRADLAYSGVDEELVAYLMGHAWNPRLHKLPNGQYVQSHKSQARYGHKSQGTAGNIPIISQDEDLDVRQR